MHRKETKKFSALSKNNNLRQINKDPRFSVLHSFKMLNRSAFKLDSLNSSIGSKTAVRGYFFAPFDDSFVAFIARPRCNFLKSRHKARSVDPAALSLPPKNSSPAEEEKRRDGVEPTGY